jgi:hypothetical protein
MSQTLIASPQTFSPAYNPLKFIVDSTNKNNSGFRYIFDIYESGTTTKIAEYKVLPRYNDGYGEQDISKLIQNFVSWDLDTLSTTHIAAPNSSFTYNVNVGEEYVYQVNYISNLTNASGNVQINVSNSFAPGDQVIITQADGGVANPQLEGLHTVVSATGSGFVVNVLWSTITSASVDGVVKYADNRKTITRDITLVDSLIGYNAAFRWTDWSTYNQTNYTLNSNTKLWLTNQPQSYRMTPGQDAWLNIRKPKLTQTVRFELSDSSTFSKSITSLLDIAQIAVGPNNNGLFSVDGIEWYDFWFDNGSTLGQQDSVKYRVYIDTRNIINEEYQILFLDRMGSFSSFAFQLKNYERGDVSREVFNRKVEGFVNGSDNWTYSTEDFGFNQLNLNVVKNLDLNTDWMTEEMGQYYEELMTSPMTFLRKVSYDCTDGLVVSASTYQPVILNTSSYEVYQQRNKNLIRQNVNVRFANQDNING